MNVKQRSIFKCRTEAIKGDPVVDDKCAAGDQKNVRLREQILFEDEEEKVEITEPKAETMKSDEDSDALAHLIPVHRVTVKPK